jgi:hypothetical protein
MDSFSIKYYYSCDDDDNINNINNGTTWKEPTIPCSEKTLNMNCYLDNEYCNDPTNPYTPPPANRHCSSKHCKTGNCRTRNCNTNLTSNSPADQYQRLKLIQNTVRVASSLYTMNLGALSAYTKPTALTYNVCWNQMSDRPVPSHQKTFVPTKGSTIGSNSTKHTVTGPRPGAQSPGGLGCDIKHNSYDRYLNRLKGKAPLRRGIIPPTFGDPIPFNNAYPIYGGKTTKTSIVNDCICPITF